MPRSARMFGEFLPLTPLTSASWRGPCSRVRASMTCMWRTLALAGLMLLAVTIAVAAFARTLD